MPRSAKRSSSSSAPSPSAATSASSSLPVLTRGRAAASAAADVVLLWLVAAMYRMPLAMAALTDPIHPDALHQSLEIAHLWVYGAGHRPFEFSVPEPAGHSAWDFFVGPTDQQADALRSQYAMRSPLLPILFSAVFRVVLVVRSDANYHSVALPTAMALYALWTSTLAAAAYLLVRRVLHLLAAERTLALLVGAIVASHDVLATLGGNPLLNSFLSPLTIASLAILSMRGGGWAQRLLAGASMGVVVYARCDQLLLCTAFALTHPRVLAAVFHPATLAGVCTSIACMAAIDRTVFGWPFAAPLRWFIFNVYLHQSTKFGTESPTFYLEIILADRGVQTLLAVAVIGGTAAAASPLWRRTPASTSSCAAHMVAATRLGACACLTVAAYSALGHKELRFAHDALVLLLCALAICAAPLVAPLSPLIPRKLGLLEAGVVVALVLSMKGLAGSFASTASPAWWFAHFPWRTPERWILHSEVNRGLAAVGVLGDATGVVLMMPDYVGQLPLSCAWSCLHSAVPIGVLAYHGKEHGLRMQLWPPPINTNVCITATLDMKAPTARDVPDGVKWILHNARFNYAVFAATLPHAQMMASLGFEEIERIGGAVVARRSRTDGAWLIDYYALWLERVIGWNCDRHFRYAPPPTPVSADAWIPMPQSVEPEGGFKVPRGGSARNISEAACVRYQMPKDINCLHWVHDVIAQATVQESLVAEPHDDGK